MAATLVPCASCARHVRATDAVCPFCNGTLSSPTTVAAAMPAGVRLGRAAIFVVGVAVAAASSAGCATGPSTGDGGDAAAESSVPDEGSVMALYGAVAPPDAGPDGGVSTRYGAPPAPADDSGYNDA